MRWRPRNLGPVPDGDHPHRLAFRPVEEPVGRDDDFAVRKFRELREDAARGGKPLEPAQDGLHPGSKSRGGRWIVPANVGEGGEELDPRGRGEPDLHRSVFSEERISFGEDGIQLEAFSRGDLPLSSGEKSQDLAIALCLVVHLRAEQHRRRAPTLGDEDGLFRVSHAAEHFRGILTEVGDRDDVRSLSHENLLLRYVLAYLQTYSQTDSRVNTRSRDDNNEQERGRHHADGSQGLRRWK